MIEILLGLSVLALLHTYVFYPLLMRSLAKNKSTNEIKYSISDNEEWPRIFVLMSLYNEEKVIAEKLQTLIDQDYPTAKTYFYVGSDCSSDKTNEIVQTIADQYSNLHFFPYTDRNGKPGVINRLYSSLEEDFEKLESDIVIITDANVMLSKDVFKQLGQHFKNPDIALVDSRMVHRGMQNEGISKAEDQYISNEVWIKNWESKTWGTMIGPFGGCYALRRTNYSYVPKNFLVDDFYIAMKCLEADKKAINELNAICFEDVTHDIEVEYRRKRRISAGNFQNMVVFRKLWWPPFKPLNFAFFSHKILRWLGPFWLMSMLIGATLLTLKGGWLYQLFALLLVVILLFIPVLDWMLSKMGINLTIFRGIRYFLLMNIALLEGFLNFLKGVKTNVWQPTKRN
ncbi:MAG: glycosyltransferase [Bacteroidota bacterium]